MLKNPLSNFNTPAQQFNQQPLTQQPKEYEFFEPIVFPPQWKLEAADINSNYALLQSNAAGKDTVSLEALAQDYTEPILFIGKPIYSMMMEIAKYASDQYSSEVAGYFLYAPLNAYSPHWEAYGIFMTGQTASGAEVESEGSDFPRYVHYLKDKDPELMLRTVISYWHSHVKMKVFWSNTDVTQQYDRSQLAPLTGSRIHLVVNAHKEIKGKYIQYSPVLFEKDDINIGISFNNPEYLDFNLSQYKPTLHNMVDSLLDVRTPAYKNWGYPGVNGDWAKWFKSDKEKAEEAMYPDRTSLPAIGDMDNTLALTNHTDMASWDQESWADADEHEIFTRLKTTIDNMQKKSLVEFISEKKPTLFTENLKAVLAKLVEALVTSLETELDGVDIKKVLSSKEGDELEFAGFHNILKKHTTETEEPYIYALKKLIHYIMSVVDEETGELIYGENFASAQLPTESMLNTAAENLLEFVAACILIDEFELANYIAETYADEILEYAHEKKLLNLRQDAILCLEMNADLEDLNNNQPGALECHDVDGLLTILLD